MNNNNNQNNQNKFDIFEKYEKMILKLNNIIEQKNKLDFEYNLIKEKIDEYEAINLIYLDELKQIKYDKLHS